jgi:Spy/CpxP family protein refolding chaperone
MKHMSIGLAILFSVVLSSAVSIAQRGPDDRPALNLLKRMQLNDEQKSKIADLGSEMAKKMVTLKADQATAHIELRQLIRAKEMDRIAIERKAKVIADLEVKQRMLKLDNWFAVNALLTPEQQVKWKKALELNRGPQGPKEGPRPERGERGRENPEPRP